MKKSIIVFFFVTFYLTGCLTPNKHPLKIKTTPEGALVSIHQASTVSDQTRLISGTTPLTKEVNFGESGQLLLEVEKRGFTPHITTISPETGTLSIELKQLKDKTGNLISGYALPNIKRILLVQPDIKVIERGFSSEKTSEERSAMAQRKIIKGVRKGLLGKCEVVSVDSSKNTAKKLRPLWRDVYSSMELLDPVRFKYVSHPPRLETKSSRKNAYELGKKYEADVILFIKGKKNLESAGFQAGIHAASAAAKVASVAVMSQNRSVDDIELEAIRHIFKASFDNGAFLGKIVAIDCKNGEILYINRGLLENILTDLSFAINHN